MSFIENIKRWFLGLGKTNMSEKVTVTSTFEGKTETYEVTPDEADGIWGILSKDNKKLFGTNKPSSSK